MTNRNQILEAIQANPQIDVLIIGGGINGVGTFRDLALQGVRVLLVERADFCSGASAASSHMIHGGIRYLENGEFRLVQEAVRERNLLIKNAPHAVKPLPTTVPIFKWFSGLLNAPLKFLGLLDRPAERGAVVIKIGMTLYDLYTTRSVAGTVPKHTFIDREKSLQQYPDLNPSVLFTGTYFDAMILMPERLTLELALEGEAVSESAFALNYVSAISARGNDVSLRDELTGVIYAVQPQYVVNAAGPWIDLVNMGLGKKSELIGGTKGSHLVLDHPQLRKAIGDHEFFFENNDGRIVLIYPLWDKVMVGTSDIAIQNPDDAVCTEDEVDYFLEMIARVFPAVRVDRSHIVFRFSGVRPLPRSKARLTGQISRDHSIDEIPTGAGLNFPVLCLVGGKWTSFRAFAAQTTDLLLRRLGLQRRVTTDRMSIGGGNGFPITEQERAVWIEQVGAKSGLPLLRIERLLDRYGVVADKMAEFITAEVDGPLQERPDYSRREIYFILQNEKVEHLDDLVLRRTPFGMLGEVTLPLLKELANLCGNALGWSEAQQEQELARVRHLFATKHAIPI
jgi:glycerol-3-phosphate dehydrogenase